jgi:carboxypeptidase C (cathepsin A)
MRIRTYLIFILFFSVANMAFAQQAIVKEEKNTNDKPIFAEEKFVGTKHSIRIGGQDVRYTATPGQLVLRRTNGEPRGNMFFVAYTLEDVTDLRSRPVTFCYNGGPGSATIWLHMGVLGPKRVQMAEEGFQPAPPYSLVDNEHSLIDVTDIVAIDAMSAGFSRAVEGEDPKQFHGVQPDIEAFAEFIRLYITKFGRWTSPKYLLGESYGTVRSAGVSQELQSSHGIELNGIVLVSSVIDFSTLSEAPGNSIYYAGFLPTYTMTALYHKKLPADVQGSLEEIMDEAREFAFGEYLLALTKGNRLTPQETDDMARKVARLTGLSPEYVKQANLRISPERFRKELLRDRRLMTGRLDSRFTGIDVDAAGEGQEFDPSNTALSGPYMALFNDYIRNELKWESELQYRTSGPVRPWDYGTQYRARYLNLVDSLRSTMARNPFLEVLVTNGIYDMATPFAATEWTFDHLGFESTYRERVHMAYYEAGHMMYIRPSMLKKFKQDVSEFILRTKDAALDRVRVEKKESESKNYWISK